MAVRSFDHLDVGWHGSHRGDAFARAPFSITSRGRPKTLAGRPLGPHYPAGWMKALLTTGPANFSAAESLLQLPPCRHWMSFAARLQHFQPNPLPGTGCGKRAAKSGRCAGPNGLKTPPAEAERLKAIGLELCLRCRTRNRAIRLRFLAGEIRRSTNNSSIIEKGLKQRGWRRQCRSGANLNCAPGIGWWPPGANPAVRGRRPGASTIRRM